ncbi:MAG: HigA family addiction module antidote protein [Treponema sp.]|jgi:addiction module HigA family antidote|nr:HigA family addiction module antidote protein [Treponema sp.]
MGKTTAKDPGSVLLSFIRDFGINPSRLGAAVKLSQSTIRQITLNKMKISVPVALRLAKCFGNSAEFWIETQLNYELENASKDPELKAELKEIQKIKKPDGVSKKASPKAEVKTRGTKKTGPAKPAKKAKPAARRAVSRRGRPKK